APPECPQAVRLFYQLAGLGYQPAARAARPRAPAGAARRRAAAAPVAAAHWPAAPAAAGGLHAAPRAGAELRRNSGRARHHRGRGRILAFSGAPNAAPPPSAVLPPCLVLIFAPA
nr:hypothetical protein [Tanacetum cinerariifolium]